MKKKLGKVTNRYILESISNVEAIFEVPRTQKQNLVRFLGSFHEFSLSKLTKKEKKCVTSSYRICDYNMSMVAVRLVVYIVYLGHTTVTSRCILDVTSILVIPYRLFTWLIYTELRVWVPGTSNMDSTLEKWTLGSGCTYSFVRKIFFILSLFSHIFRG